MRIILFLSLFFPVLNFAGEIQRGENGSFHLADFPTQVLCQAIRDHLVEYQIEINASPFEIYQIDPDRRVLLFSGQKVSPTANCQGETQSHPNQKQATLQCIEDVPPRWKIQTRIDLRLAETSEGQMNFLRSGSINQSHRWDLKNCRSRE